MTSSSANMTSCQHRGRRLPVSSVLVLLLLLVKRSLCQPGDFSVSSTDNYTGSAMLADQSVLELYVVEELPARSYVGNIPRDMEFNRKYSMAELAELRYSLLSKPIVGPEAGAASASKASTSHSDGSTPSDLERSMFTVDEVHGTIRTADRLDRESLCRRPAELQQSAAFATSHCVVRFDVAVRPMTHFRIVRVRVKILDVNDNEPTFPVESIALTIPETAAPGTSLHLPIATDADAGKNSVRHYTLATPIDVFRLVERSRSDLRLVVTSHLDREATAMYHLVIVAEDDGDPARSGTLQVDVTVLDANDHTPRFTVSNASYAADVPEDASPGTVLLTIRATDSDHGSNARISYSLAPDRTFPRDVTETFAIGETTGELYTVAPLDRERDSVYRMYVIAVDKPETEVPLSAIASVEIRVIDVNDQAPHIRVNSPTAPEVVASEPAVAAPEGGRKSGHDTAMESGNATTFLVNRESPVGTFICHVTVEDLDVGENGRFACRLVGLSASKFQLHRMYKTEYKVVTSSRLDVANDYKDDEVYDFNIVCRDSGSPATLTSSLPVRVRLTSADEGPLTCARDPYLVTIAENNDVGVTIVEPYTLVKKTGGELGYHLGDADKTDLVSVNSQSGLVTLQAVLDRERKEKFSFSVVISDVKRTVTCHVHVTVTDINDNKPSFVFPSLGNDTVMFIVSSSTPYVARIAAEDPDAIGSNSDVVYAITQVKPEIKDGTTETNVPKFVVDQHSGVVKVVTGEWMLSATRQRFDVKVTATDRGHPMLSAEGVLKVFIGTEFEAEELSGQQQRRSTSVKFPGTGETDSHLFSVLLTGSLIALLVVIVAIIIILVFTIADRKRRITTTNSTYVTRRETKATHFEGNFDVQPNSSAILLPPKRCGPRTSCDASRHSAPTPSKKVVIFVKDATVPPSAGSAAAPSAFATAEPERQVVTSSCHATSQPTAEAAGPHSPNSDDSGRGRSSEDGTGVVDSLQASSASGGHHVHHTNRSTANWQTHLGAADVKTHRLSSSDRVVIDVSNSYPTVSITSSSSAAPVGVSPVPDNLRHSNLDIAVDNAHMDYCNSLRRTPSLSSSVDLTGTDYQNWLLTQSDHFYRLAPETTCLAPETALGSRLRSGTLSTTCLNEKNQPINYHHHHTSHSYLRNQLPVQRGGMTSFGARSGSSTGVDIIAMRPFSTLTGRRTSTSTSDDQHHRGLVGDAVPVSMSSSTGTSSYTLPQQRRRRDPVWPDAAVEGSGAPPAPPLPPVPDDVVSAVAMAGARVLRRQMPGMRCVVSADGGAVYRTVVPPVEWLRTKQKIATPTGECETNAHLLSSVIGHRANGNETTVVYNNGRLGSSMDSIV